MDEIEIYTDSDSGLSFEYQINRDGIVVAKTLTCGKNAEIPGSIGGTAVTAVGEYAFAGRNGLKEVRLPRSATRIGRHAFYNCRRLAGISLSAEAAEIGDGAFKNCEALHVIRFDAVRGGMIGLKNILYDLEQDILCEIRIFEEEASVPSGRPTGEIKLMFPRNSYEYISNYAARIFHEVAHGSGYYYRQCVYEKTVDFKRYDGLFGYAAREERQEIVLLIALLRIRFPYELSDAARTEYIRYLRGHLTELVRLIIKEDDFGAALMTEAAGECGNAEYAGFFLKCRMERFGAAAKRFEL